MNEDLVKRLQIAEACGISSTRFQNKPLFWKAAKGTKVICADNKEYIDCTSSYGVMGIGYSNPYVIKKVSEQIAALTHTMCEIYPHETYLHAIESILKVVGRDPSDQVLLTQSGSEAVEVALKLAYRYTHKEGVIAFNGSFHGQSIGALAVTSYNAFRDPFSPLITKNVTFIDYPNSYRNGYETETNLLNACIDRIENLLTSGQTGGSPYGAIIVEPMQNASGYIVPPVGFLRKLREMCSKHDLVLIADEIFTGFGRCGRWLACDYEDVIADIVCVGKVMGGGFPAAACVASSQIMEALDYAGMVPLHGSTFAGNAVSCIAISTTIELLSEDNLIIKSYENGEYLRSGLRNVMSQFEFVGDIRGIGSATTIEFVKSRITKERFPNMASVFYNYLKGKGIITLITGLPYGNCIAFCPPFIMMPDELNLIIQVCCDFVGTFDGMRCQNV